MNPIELIEIHSKDFTKSESKIKDYVLENLDQVVAYTIVEIAEATAVSKSAILRFCQKLGYAGYSEFKYDCSKFLLSGSHVEQSATNSQEIILDTYSECLSAMRDQISSAHLESLAQLIVSAKKIKIFGIHETALAAQYFQFRLLALNIDTDVVSNTHVFQSKACAPGNDLNIFLSLSGKTDPIVDTIHHSHQAKINNILITQNDKVPYRKKLKEILVFPTTYSSLVEHKIFIDAQPLFFVLIELLINHIAKTSQ